MTVVVVVTSDSDACVACWFRPDNKREIHIYIYIYIYIYRERERDITVYILVCYYYSQLLVYQYSHPRRSDDRRGCRDF